MPYFIWVYFVTDYEFTLYPASTLASCSIAAALRGLGVDGHLSRLHELTGIDSVNNYYLLCWALINYNIYLFLYFTNCYNCTYIKYTIFLGLPPNMPRANRSNGAGCDRRKSSDCPKRARPGGSGVDPASDPGQGAQ